MQSISNRKEYDVINIKDRKILYKSRAMLSMTASHHWTTYVVWHTKRKCKSG
jgi:hypothetical protein